MADIKIEPQVEDTTPKHPFIHLHNHTHFSLLQAVPKVKDLIKAAVANKMPAIAITDAGNMYGTIEFFKKCKEANIKPIIGVDFFVSARTRHDKEPRIDNRRSRLILIAKDQEGYKNLIRLVTASNFEGFYYKPRIDRELVEKYKEGLLCIMPSFSGELTQAIVGHNSEHAKETADFYKKNFGDDFYVEITHHEEIEGHEENMRKLIEFARAENIKLVAAHDTYYIKKEDSKTRDVLMKIADQFGERNRDDDADFSFINQEEADELFKNEPDAILNCKEIMDKCNLEITLGKWLFPEYVVESGKSADDELFDLTYKGVERRKLPMTEEAKARIEFELSVIKTKGYSAYFLVVADLLRYAHENGILTNIRGSVAGSITTYLTGITNVNPLEYKLPFERFLNPERPSAPDIDMDFADNRRDQMIGYTRDKYGADKVAQIGTFGTMMARGAVKDVARALGYPYTLGDKISKLIPMGQQGFAMTIDRAITETPELEELYKKDSEVRTIIDMAKKIEGNARHISVHAAGVVVSPITLTDVVPLQLDPKGGDRIITQYDMRSVDENNAGLMKFDFLGIKNLSQLADAIILAEKIEGIKVDLDNIPLDDQKAFDMLARGETNGLFQLNGTGMTRFLKELKPTSIHDINAMVALYRPGPMETIPEYIRRKNDPRLTKYEDPRMEKYLKESFGLIVYQDDLLFSAIELAGYSWLEADKFRKAVGKKNREEMANQKIKLTEGIIKRGQTKAFAEKLWKLFEPFQAYGFNKAHAASYGRLAYQTAYMKANFPAIYMAAILTGAHGDVDEIASFVSECKRMNIPTLPPNINESFGNFTVIKGSGMDASGEQMPDSIRFGLYSIKNFGEGIANVIIEERKKGGKFKTLEDFLNRIKDKNLNKKSLEALVKSGAMDQYGDRGVMIANTQDLLEYNKEQMARPENQESLFSMFDTDTSTSGVASSGSAGDKIGGYGPHLKLQELGHATQTEKLAWEKELLGLYLSGHPLDKYKAILEKREMNVAKVLQIIAEEEEKERLEKEALSAQEQLDAMMSDAFKAEKAEKEKLAAEKAKKSQSANKGSGWSNKQPYDKNKKKFNDEGTPVIIAGIIEEAKEIATKKDPTVKMMFLRIADLTGVIEAVVFPKTYELLKSSLVQEKCVIVKGKTSNRNGTPSIIIDTVKELN